LYNEFIQALAKNIMQWHSVKKKTSK